MDFLRAISIRVRLTLILSAMILGLSILVGFNLYTKYQTLYEQQQIKVQTLVESAHSIFAQYHERQLNGELTQTEAQQLASGTIAKLRYEGNNYFWINDYQPVMIMHPFKPELNGKLLRDNKDPDGTPLFRNMVDIVSSEGAGFVPYKWPKPGADEPVDKISYVKGFEPWGWIIGTGIYIDNLSAMFYRQMTTNLIISVLIILFVGGFIYFTGRSILVPTYKVSRLMENVSEGDGDLTHRMEVKGHDEITELCAHFNVFAEKMRCSLQNLAENVSSVSGNAELLSETSNTVSDVTQHQRDTSTQVAAAMEQMSVNIKEVSGNAGSAEEAAIAAKQNTQSGKSVVSDTIRQIESLSGSIDKVSNVVHKLSEESVNIGSVLDVIRGIAEQTNLLALNAAIEAARAGEQGRGFAVVADEVRTLASRTGQSTDEIQRMIERLQDESKQAVSAVSESQETSNRTIEIAQQADAALTEIDHLMSTITEMNSQIARAMDQQTQAADEVSLRINELSGVADESAEISQKLASTGCQLRENSQRMSQVVARFKLA